MLIIAEMHPDCLLFRQIKNIETSLEQNERVGLIGERLAVAKCPKSALKHLQTCGGHLGGQLVKAGSQKTEPRRVPVVVLGEVDVGMTRDVHATFADD